MALIRETGAGLSLPLVHSRSYLKTTRQTQTLLRHYTRKHSPRGGTPPAPQQYRWHDWLVKLRRHFLKEMAEHWKAGTIPHDQAWWEALAAANPITNYKGTSAIVSGKEWFLWYETMAWEHYLFFRDYYAWESMDTMFAPVLPWNPEATPDASVLSATSPTKVAVNFTSPGAWCYWTFCAWFAFNTKLTTGPPWPQHIARYDRSYSGTPPGAEQYLPLYDLRPTTRPGTRARMFWNFFIQARYDFGLNKWVYYYQPTPLRSLEFTFT